MRAAPTPPSRLLRPERRITVFFLAQSMSVGVANGFAGIWFASQGLGAFEIGVLGAAPVLVLLLTGQAVGRLADRARDWRVVIIRGAVASAIFPLGLLFADSFAGVLVFWTLAVVSQWAIVPVADAAALRLSRRRGADFGAFRAWGTIGYLTALTSAGYALRWFGSQAFLPLFIGLSLFRGLAAFALPTLRAEDHVPAERPARLGTSLRPALLLPLIGWALIYATHLILNAFQGLLWLEQGLAPDTIGLLIALGAVAETVLFFAFKRFARRFSNRLLLITAGLVAVGRWLLLALAPGVAVLVGVQLLHALSYALGFLACANLIADETSEAVAAEAQSFSNVLEQAVAVPALILFGSLAGLYGSGAYVASAAIAGLGVLLIAASLRLARR